MSKKVRKFRRLFSVVLALVIIVTAPSVSVWADEAVTSVKSGTCGDGLTWELDSGGTLTISGNGAMENYKWGSSPWYNDEYVKRIVIEQGVTSIGSAAFSGCSGLANITIPYGITSIGKAAFSGCCELTDITIPESVISIGQEAFSGCSGLTSITIPESVTSISGGEFLGCSGLTSITIPESVTSIGDYAFYGCSGLTSITIPESVTSISAGAFEGCSELTSITIPESVTSIEQSAFSGCSGLTSITIPNSVTSIGWFAFYECSGLTSITISESVTSISWCEFLGCSGLTSITIPDSVTSIGGSAFYGCSGLTSMTIPDSVTFIGELAFYDCSGLTSITIPDSVTIIKDNAFEGCSGLTNMTIPNGVTAIEYETFSNCCNLMNVTIPDSITVIEYGAFSNCSSLMEVTIPESVTGIGDGAYAGCSNLSTIYFEGDAPELIKRTDWVNGVEQTISGHIFDGVTATAYYPAGNTTYTNEVKKAFGGNITWVEKKSGDSCQHNYSESVTKAATCTEAGIKTYICSVCGDTYTESIPATGHTEVIDAEVPATYESEGKTEGSHCSVCETIIKAQQTIPKLKPSAPDDTPDLTGWSEEGFWYENGVKQGVQYKEDGSIDLSYRGKEIYDPVSNAWYWLDNIQNGAVAKSKDVYQESAAGAWADNKVYNEDGSLNTDASTGKWVRYDENGHMIKGWNTNNAGTYYFDTVYGTMAKGHVVIGDNECYFDENTGIGYNGWLNVDGMNYWYENGIRQGYNVNDKDYRGKEIYDAASDAWYWLDNVQNGAVAKSKDVYQESYAGIFADREDGTGKWVRYDENGHMIKGWSEMNGNTYYFDYQTGAMAKGWANIDGADYYFDEATGIMR